MRRLLAVGALLVAPAAAQTPPGAAVAGVVRAVETGEPLAAAVVALTDLDRVVITGADGRYMIAAVPAGPQHLAVRRLGYRSRTLHLLVPRHGPLEFDIMLEPSPVPVEDLSVAPAPAVRGLGPAAGSGFPDRSVTHAMIRDHPTLSMPDPLLALGGGEVLAEPEAPSGLHVRGGAPSHTGYLLDGVPVLAPFHAAGVFGAWNSDALAGLELAAATPSPALPDALSGVIVARTRRPGDRLRLWGALSSAEGRVTVDGPVASGAGSFLLSWRAGFPGTLLPAGEPSYLSGETSDFVGAGRVRVAGGRLRIVVYDAENELGAAAASGSAPTAGARHAFEWTSRSLGAWWESDPGPARLRLGVWRASAGAGSMWAASPTVELTAERVDRGAHLSIERRGSRTTGEVGLRYRRSWTAYRTDEGEPTSPWGATGAVDVVSAFGSIGTDLGAGVDGWVGLAASAAAETVHLGPRARLRWRPGERLGWSVSYSRTHQFSQSLRNPESVVARVFPADPSVAAGTAGVPVPRSDQLVAAGEWTPVPGLRLVVQGFTRRLEGLVVVAPLETGPFATSGFATGGASVRGAAIELSAGGARYGAVASYGWQRVRLTGGGASYQPGHGTTHTLDAGVVVFPSPTTAARISVTAAAGRVSTLISGPFEWESCNALDQGCEFAGTPRLAGPPGGRRLPAYARLDVGGRKHWHVNVRGRDLLVGLFATLTNVLGRRNVLTEALAADGDPEPVSMVPRAPLVLGLETRF